MIQKSVYVYQGIIDAFVAYGAAGFGIILRVKLRMTRNLL